MPPRTSRCAWRRFAGPLRPLSMSPENPAEPAGARITLRPSRGSGAQPPFRPRRRCSCWPVAPGRQPADLYTSYAGAFARINRNPRYRAARPARHRSFGAPAVLATPTTGRTRPLQTAPVATSSDAWRAWLNSAIGCAIYTTSVAVDATSRRYAMALGYRTASICTLRRTGRALRSYTCATIRRPRHRPSYSMG